MTNHNGKLLIASSNPGKISEIRSLLIDLPIDLITPSDIGQEIEVDEVGQTYQENAYLKAKVYSQTTGLTTIADDSGLEVNALGGLPGIRSARFAAQPDAKDKDRRTHLLKQLKQHPQPWTARFRCVIVLASPFKETYTSEGICEGEIIEHERGDNGFGYDPIFLLPDLGRTMAELTLQEKNRYSHRARAVRAAIPLILDIFS